MNRIFRGMIVAGTALLVGCNQGVPGGPGVVNTTSKPPAMGQLVNTFNLSVPVMTTNIKQGERKSTTFSVKRGKEFNEDVTLKFDGLPTGVKLSPSPALISHSETETKLMLSASDDASLGDFTIVVTGHPAKGADAIVDFKISVEKK